MGFCGRWLIESHTLCHFIGMLVMSNVCKCGKGYASDYDNKCKFCREEMCGIPRSILKKYVRYRGDGLRVEDYLELMKKI